MQQNPSWETHSRSAGQEILCTLWNPNAHYRFLKSLHLHPNLSQQNPVHNPTSYFFKIHFITTFSHKPKYPIWSFLTIFSELNLACISHLCYITYPSHSLLFSTLILFHAEYKLWSFLLCNFLPSPITSSVLGSSSLFAKQHNGRGQERIKSRAAFLLCLEAISICDILFSCNVMNNFFHLKLASLFHILQAAVAFQCFRTETCAKPISSRWSGQITSSP
jgi:hypothetical protein